MRSCNERASGVGWQGTRTRGSKAAAPRVVQRGSLGHRFADDSMSSPLALSAAGLAIRLCAKAMEPTSALGRSLRYAGVQPVQARRYAIAAATGTVRLCAFTMHVAVVPALVLSAQVAVVTTFSAGFTVWTRMARDVGTDSVEMIKSFSKSLPQRANVNLSKVQKRLAGYPTNLPEDHEARIGAEANVVIRQHAEFERRREAEQAALQPAGSSGKEDWSIDMCGA